MGHDDLESMWTMDDDKITLARNLFAAWSSGAAMRSLGMKG
ncbi:MAG: hypothetical protein OEU32_17665 [Acidimicrobiia bacterium]|nr:hypothetical protein [Acidimicrobiia bacterium]